MATESRHEAITPRKPVKRKQRCSCVWWLILGGAMGGATTQLYWLRQAPAPAQPETAHKDERPTPPPPSFRFPSILTGPEVEIGTSESTPAVKPPVPPTPPPGAGITNGGYFIQVGSFKLEADAEHLRTEIAKYGLTASIHKATLDTGQTTHRVRVGPYENKKDAEQARAILKRNHKDGVLIPAHTPETKTHH